MTEPTFPEDSWVEVRYPLTDEQENADRDGWPWLPGWVVAECGPDSGRSACTLPSWPSSTRARPGTRCASEAPPEIRLPEAQANLERPAGPELEAQ